MKIKSTKLTKLAITLFGAVSVLSCSTMRDANSSIDQTGDAIAQADQKLSSAQSIANNNFNYDDDSIYLGEDSVQLKETEKLPIKFSNNIQIDSAYTSMRQIADILQRITGYPVLLNVENQSQYIRLTQTHGNLVDILNSLCAQTDTAWSFLNGKLVISDLETETFFIKALPGDVTVSNQVNSNNGINSQSNGSATAGDGGGGGSATGQSQSSNDQNTIQNVQFNLNHSIWNNISDTTKGMLTKAGTMSVSPSTSSLTVTDKPSNILKIAQYIKKQNDMLKQQVQIDVQVFTVETTAEDNYMINWNLILKGSNANFNMNGMAGGTTGNAATGMVPVFSPTATTQSFTVASTSGSFAGSQLIANALSTQTRSSLVTSAAATTLNNQPVPIQIIEQQGYISNVSTTQVAQAGTQQSVTTGQLSYGFTLNVLPTIEKNGLVNLQLSLNLSSLKALKNFSVTGAMVQLPDMIQRNAMQKVTMRNGDTYVTTGFDSDFNTVTNAGVGSPSFWLFGGGVSAQKTRQKVVILVTPRIVKM